LKIN
jgi:hypothetical protein